MCAEDCDVCAWATIEYRERGGTMRRGMGTTLERERERERERSKLAAIAHTLAQITTCSYTQMNHICTKSTRQTSRFYIDGKQNK